MSHEERLDQINDPIQVMKAFAIHAPVGIQIYDASGHWVYINEKFVSIFGSAPPPGYCVLNDELIAASGNTDVVMPGLDGIEMVQIMAKSKPGQKAIFVSAYSDEKISGFREQQKDAFFMQKPYTAVDLLTRIRDLLKN